MEIEKIINQIEELLTIVKSWDTDCVPTIEKDYLMHKLSSLYIDIKYHEAHSFIKPDTTPDRSASESGSTSGDEIPADSAAPEITGNGYDDLKPRKDKTFEHTPCETRRKFDKNAILSLYDNEPTRSVPAQSGQLSDVDSPITDEQADVDSPITDEQAEEVQKEYDTVDIEIPVINQYPENTATRDFNEAGETAVLGDVIAPRTETVSDNYARNNPQEDVASMIGSSNIGELRGSIGINDKFLMVRDLFSGDQQAYENAIDSFEQFTSLDDALLFIHANYKWKPDSEGVRLLMDLLSRKLS